MDYKQEFVDILKIILATQGQIVLLHNQLLEQHKIIVDGLLFIEQEDDDYRSLDQDE